MKTKWFGVWCFVFGLLAGCHALPSKITVDEDGKWVGGAGTLFTNFNYAVDSIATNAVNVATNTANIAANAVNINSNTALISSNAVDIAAIVPVAPDLDTIIFSGCDIVAVNGTYLKGLLGTDYYNTSSDVILEYNDFTGKWYLIDGTQSDPKPAYASTGDADPTGDYTLTGYGGGSVAPVADYVAIGAVSIEQVNATNAVQDAVAAANTANIATNAVNIAANSNLVSTAVQNAATGDNIKLSTDSGGNIDLESSGNVNVYADGTIFIDSVCQAGAAFTVQNSTNATEALNNATADTKYATVAQGALADSAVQPGDPFAPAFTEVTTATYSLLSTDFFLHVTRTVSGTCAITIPTAQNEAGRSFVVKDGGLNADTYAISIDCQDGGDLIDGVGTAVTITNSGESLRFYSDGTDWFTY